MKAIAKKCNCCYMPIVVISAKELEALLWTHKLLSPSSTASFFFKHSIIYLNWYSLVYFYNYSRDPNNEHSNNGTIQITNCILLRSPFPDQSLLFNQSVTLPISHSTYDLNNGLSVCTSKGSSIILYSGFFYITLLWGLW